MTFIPTRVAVDGTRVNRLFVWRLSINNLSDAAFHCAASSNRVISWKVFGRKASFSPSEQLPLDICGKVPIPRESALVNISVISGVFLGIEGGQSLQGLQLAGLSASHTHRRVACARSQGFSPFPSEFAAAPPRSKGLRKSFTRPVVCT